MIGERFSKLTVIADAGSSGGRKYFLCRCDCGGTVTVRKTNLRSGNTRACGCGRSRHVKRRPHSEHVGTPLYHTYHHMKARCYSPSSTRYENWGGRGITVCAEWLADFDNFHRWACANGYAAGLSLERIDNDGPYSPDNCRWVPRGEQSRNTRKNVRIEAFGEVKLLSDWAKDPRCVVTLEALRQRLRRMPAEPAITSPPHSWRNKPKSS